MSDPPKVFISYSHDSPEHARRVLGLANRLRADGIDAILDQYEPWPAEGWPRWMEHNIDAADFVLMICTRIYYQRVTGKEEQGKGLGVQWEGNLIYNRLYQVGSVSWKFIPVFFDNAESSCIPTPVQGCSWYLLDGQYEDLYRRLTNQPATAKPELGKRRALPPYQAQWADFPSQPSAQAINPPPQAADEPGRQRAGQPAEPASLSFPAFFSEAGKARKVSGMSLGDLVPTRQNRTALIWLCGSLVALAAGIWVVIAHLSPAQTAAPINVEAQGGSVATGGDISGSQITIQGPSVPVPLPGASPGIHAAPPDKSGAQ